MNLSNLEICLLGATGSLGKTLVNLLVKNYDFKGLRIFSRDELKQWELRKSIDTDKKIVYIIGDVNDRNRVYRALNRVDIVINCAAMKQVPTCEKNPKEAIKTNINGAENILDAAIDNGVEKVMHISTDKSVLPINLYGMTKAVAEKLFVDGNTYSGGRTLFSICRYGNVLGSRGSVIPLFREQAKTGAITITDRRMTRFWIRLEEVAQFILDNIENMNGGEIFIPKMPSMNIEDLAKVVAPNVDIKEIGIRPGEKIHEIMITEEESFHTKERDNMFIIDGNYAMKNAVYDNSDPWSYESNKNNWNLTADELRKLLNG